MAALAGAQAAAFRPLRQPTRTGRRACAVQCQQQDPLLLRVARGEGAAAVAGGDGLPCLAGFGCRLRDLHLLQGQ